MKFYLSKTHSDENGEIAEEGKLGIIYSSKDDILELCRFFDKVKSHIQNNDNCHMHFRDSCKNWSHNSHIDIEINIENI